MNVHHPPFCVLLCLCCISRLVVEALTRLESSADDSIRHHHPCFTYDLLYYLLLLLLLCFCVNECEKNGCVDFFPRLIRLLSYRYRQFIYFLQFFFSVFGELEVAFFILAMKTLLIHISCKRFKCSQANCYLFFFLLLPQIC